MSYMKGNHRRWGLAGLIVGASLGLQGCVTPGGGVLTTYAREHGGDVGKAMVVDGIGTELFRRQVAIDAATAGRSNVNINVYGNSPSQSTLSASEKKMYQDPLFWNLVSSFGESFGPVKGWALARDNYWSTRARADAMIKQGNEE